MSKPAILGGQPVFPKNHRWPSWPHATGADERRLLRVVRSGAWGIGCPETKRFATRFAQQLGVRHVLPVSTGTAALELAIKALGIGPGDEVIIPAYTFIATATCVLQMGAIPVFADIDPRTFNIAPPEIRRLLSSRTRAVIPVHFGGNPCDVAGIRKVLRGRNVDWIEDAAHAHGMVYRGRAGGTLGRAGCFSFQSSKNMASGEGGVLATDDSRLFELADSFHSFGRRNGRPWYEHHVLSWNQRLSGLQAALLVGQLERLETQSRARHTQGTFLNAALADIPGQTPQADGDRHPETRRAYHLYIWRYDAAATGLSHARFIAALKAEGVPASAGYPIALPRNPMFIKRRFWHAQRMGGGRRRAGEPNFRTMKTPVTDRLCAEAVWLPQNLLLAKRADLQSIVDAVAKIVENASALRNQ